MAAHDIAAGESRSAEEAETQCQSTNIARIASNYDDRARLSVI